MHQGARQFTSSRATFRQSRFRRAINEERWRDTSEYIRRPRTAGAVELKGLARRRDNEAVLFLEGVPEDATEEPSPTT